MAACSASDSENGATGTNQTEEGNNEQVFTLKTATWADKNLTQNAGYDVFVDLVEKNSNGRIKIEYVGGPEAIPAFNQGEAVQNGTVDLVWTAAGYYSELVPEALAAAPSELTYEEELERGAWEFMSKFHEEKMNAKLLGRAGYGQFAFFLNKEAISKGFDSTDDFNGLKIRGHAMYVPLLESMGASVISMPGEEIYNAFARGIIDGFGWISYGVPDLGVQDIIAAKILPEFHQMDVMILMNLDTWNSLPEDLQQIVQDAAIQSYFEQKKLVDDKLAEVNKQLEESGVQFIELNDADKFMEIANEYSWEWLGEKIDNIDEFKKYFRK